MGLFDRIGRVFRANVNSMVTNAEDPEKILEQAVLQMQEDLVQMRQAVASAIATQKRTERQAQQAQATSQEWYRRAQMALQQGNDTMAREALTRRKSYQDTANAMQSQIEQQNAIVGRMKQDMQTLESKLSEAKTKKDMYIARARSAEASVRLREMLGGVDTSQTLNAFERMEERVMQLEAQSELVEELKTDQLQKQFASLEAASDIDAELAQMKSQLLSGTQNPAQLPGETSTPTQDRGREYQ